MKPIKPLSAAPRHPLAGAAVCLSLALLALAGCDRRPADQPLPSDPNRPPMPSTTVPDPMSPASAASR